MGRNNKKIDKEDIENQLSLYDVISKYTHLTQKGKGKYIGICPFHNDSKPSFHLDENKGVYKCFPCGRGGNNIFSFIMDKENCDFQRALYLLKQDYNPNLTRKIIKKKEHQEILIDFVDQPYTKEHLKYWEKLEMDEKFLTSDNIFAVKDWAIGTKYNKRKVAKTEGEITFCYYAEDIDRCKILRIGPEITPDIKWRNSCPNNYLFYKDQIPDNCEQLFLCKSVKDRQVFKKAGRNAIAVQNESAIIQLENNYEYLNNISKEIIIHFGNDMQGWHESLLLTEYTGWNYFNIENHLYEQYGIEDVSDYLNAGFSYKQLENKLKQKGL